ncbi:MAG: MATE family efflux transporter [Gammaproteobacteria bacterium]|nr:MAG: MATE family efflux transporter [Gammaproteobacteria bacterium]
MVAGLAQTANGFVDAVMAGQASALDLAAVSVGSSIWITVYLLINGILVGLTPVVAQLQGAGNHLESGATGKQGLWIGLILGVMGFVFLRNCGFLFTLVDIEEQLSALTLAYLNSIAWGFLFIAFFMVLKSFCEGLSITKPMMVISFIGLLVNIPLNWIFIFGKFGAPALGGQGCGVATAIVMALMACLLGFYVATNRRCQASEFNLKLPLPNIKMISHLLYIGLPIGISLFIEVSIFPVISLLISSLGAEVVAGHQVALNIVSLLFMLPLSISFAVTVRVGLAVGEQDYNALNGCLKSGLGLSLAVAGFNALLILLLRKEIPSLYNENIVVVTLASELLLFAMIFQVSDSLQVFAQGALRGLKDTLIAMKLMFVAYWLIGLPLGIVFGITSWITEPMGPHGFWLGLVIGLTAAAILLIYQLLKSLRSYPSP